jgi:hypothetical protein
VSISFACSVNPLDESGGIAILRTVDDPSQFVLVDPSGRTPPTAPRLRSNPRWRLPVAGVALLYASLCGVE